MSNVDGLRLTVRDREAGPRIPNTSVSEILTQDLGTKCAVAKFIPRRLPPEQKERRAAVGRPVGGPKVPTLKGTEASCPVYNVSCILYLFQ